MGQHDQSAQEGKRLAFQPIIRIRQIRHTTILTYDEIDVELTMIVNLRSLNIPAETHYEMKANPGGSIDPEVLLDLLKSERSILEQVFGLVEEGEE